MDWSWKIPPEATDLVIELMSNGGSAVEFGSGDGSALLVDSGIDLISFEHNEEYLDTQQNTIYAPLEKNIISDEAEEVGWYNQEIVRENWPNNVQLVLIDGPPGKIGRSGIFQISDLLIGVPYIIIDDTHRIAEQNLSDKFMASIGGDRERISSQLFDYYEVQRHFDFIKQ